MGEVLVPKNALWGTNSKGLENFPISGIKMDFPFTNSFVDSLGLIKDAAARANKKLNLLDQKKLMRSLGPLKKFGKANAMKSSHDVFQTGSGTSSNMNANEVIANLATKYGGIQIDPNDDVNMSQSSNDVIPTAIKVSAYKDLTEKLYPALDKLISEIKKKKFY